MTKKTKKPAKPVFVIDLTQCEDAEEMYEALLNAKFEAKLPLTNYEIDKLIEYRLTEGVCDVLDNLFGGHNALVLEGDDINAFDAVKVEITEKQPWYKRLWNWITRKK